MKTVKVGVIGLGSWGECHLEAYRSLKQVEIAAICDMNEQRLQEVGDRFGIRDRYTDYNAMLERDDLDLVNIVTVESAHLDPTLKALNSGKHVLVEKPVSSNVEEAKQMWEAAQRNNRFIFPGHVLRFEPRYAEIYRAIRSGRLGEPVSMYMKRSRPKSMFDTYKRTHVVYVSMVHDLDQAIWYTGSRVASVKAYAKKLSGAETPEILWATVQFESGAIAFLQSNWMTPDAAGIGMNDSIEVIGREGIAQFDNRGTGLEFWTGEGRDLPDVSVHLALAGASVGALREEMNYAVTCVAQGKNPNYLSFEDAIHGIEVANAIIESSETGKVVYLNGGHDGIDGGWKK